MMMMMMIMMRKLELVLLDSNRWHSTIVIIITCAVVVSMLQLCLFWLFTRFCRRALFSGFFCFLVLILFGRLAGWLAGLLLLAASFQHSTMLDIVNFQR